MITRSVVQASWWDWVNALCNCTNRWRPYWSDTVWVYSSYFSVEHEETCRCQKCEQWNITETLHRKHVYIRDAFERGDFDVDIHSGDDASVGTHDELCGVSS